MNQIIPSKDDYQTLQQIGQQALASSLLDPKLSPAKAMLIMLKGRELNIPPIMALSEISVINGKTTMSAVLMLSLVRKCYPHLKIKFEQTDQKCSVSVLEDKETGWQTFSFSMDDAKRAGLLDKKGPWHSYPRAMMRSRAVSEMCRSLFPDALMGAVYTSEELDGEVRDVDLEVVQEKPIAQSTIATHKEGSKVVTHDSQPSQQPGPDSSFDLVNRNVTTIQAASIKTIQPKSIIATQNGVPITSYVKEPVGVEITLETPFDAMSESTVHVPQKEYPKLVAPPGKPVQWVATDPSQAVTIKQAQRLHIIAGEAKWTKDQILEFMTHYGLQGFSKTYSGANDYLAAYLEDGYENWKELYT
jgi:hypothetical protein